MPDETTLRLYEEFTLLALKDHTGVFTSCYPEQSIAGAIMAELLLEGHITLEDPHNPLVNVETSEPIGDPILDNCLQRIRKASWRKTLRTWIAHLGGSRDILNQVAKQLCDKEILQDKEEQILFLFTRKYYPEINPEPEQKVINRLYSAIFEDEENIDPQTVILISLTYHSKILNEIFDSEDVRLRKKRIKSIINGDLTGQATKEAIESCQAAMLTAALMPVFMMSSFN